MHLADPIAAQPPDLLDHLEPVAGRIAHVVVREDRRRLRTLHDPDVVARRDGVFQSEDDARLLGRGRDLAQRVADEVHFGRRRERAFAEERQQHHLDAQCACDRNRIGDPALTERVALQVVAVQDVEAHRRKR